ncbi:hypothetical protein CAPTEDRAFT_199625 [Capitella teleta]|uniref:Uncharacterized protein n=1 Tax=Capitella teleta TaxID=283909 RepID=R7UFS6_CAPTE|nr:hypothetical protein CAPTEDRAFT_199625 [Capitella teleta]|eukprot:ELU02653.1 hypothetical protein CAPTEDRAFT_199625 [Capitella teleta]
MAVDILPATLKIFEKTMKMTSFENSLDAATTFDQLRSDITIAPKSPEGQKLIQKFFFLGKTVTTEGTFNDMVKIAWRMVKEIPQCPLRKMSLLFLSIGTLCTTARASEVWSGKIENWLGNQLTTGGKGCTGHGFTLVTTQ